MTAEEISKAKDPDLSASMQAIQRAAALARRMAMQTATGIVIVKEGQIVRVPADQLRRELGA